MEVSFAQSLELMYTRRERLKSALYLRLKLVKWGTLSAFWKSSLLQNIKKIEGDNKIRKFFWKNFRKNEKWEFWNSLRVPKTREGGPFGLFETSVCCKISKNLKGGPFGDKKNLKIFWKKFKKTKKENFESLSAEKLERGDPLGFLKLQFAAKYQKTWRWDRLATKENSKKKSHSAEKNSKGWPCSPVRFGILR